MPGAPTTCPFCGCGCGFFLLAQGGDLIGVAPSETHPVARGKVCARGWCAHEATLWGRRLELPMLGSNGATEVVSWDTALEQVAYRLKELVKAGKPVGVLGSPRATNEENYLLGRLARVGLHTNHVDFCYRSVCGPLMAGVEDVTGQSSFSVQLEDLESADAILLLEGDLARTHPRAASCVLRALIRGAKLIVIGGTRTRLARLASRFFQTSPGSEGDALNSLLAAVIEARPRANIDASTLDMPLDSGASTDMRDAAKWLSSERAVFLMGPLPVGSNQLRRDAAALASLAALTGHVNQPGGGVLLLLARSNARGACDMGIAPDRLPGYEKLHDPRARQRIESLWNSSLPAGAGLDAASMLEDVRGLIVLADDPIASLLDSRKARAALGRLEFLVALDAFATPITEVANAVLPIAAYGETEGTFTNIEGRCQRLSAAVSAPGEALDGWKALAELSERLGAGGPWDSADHVFAEIAHAAPNYDDAAKGLYGPGWASGLLNQPECAHIAPQDAGPGQTAGSPFVLAHDGTFDWSGEAMVLFSPTLNRDYQSARKLFPNGWVGMNAEDADALGFRDGYRVKLTSARGEAVVPIRKRDDLRRGTLLAPFEFRESFSGVLPEDGIAPVNIERV